MQDNKNPRKIKRNANNHDMNNGETPLHDAAVRDHTEIYRLIMDSVEDKNPKDFDSDTPRHRAAENCCLDI